MHHVVMLGSQAEKELAFHKAICAQPSIRLSVQQNHLAGFLGILVGQNEIPIVKDMDCSLKAPRGCGEHLNDPVLRAQKVEGSRNGRKLSSRKG